MSQAIQDLKDFLTKSPSVVFPDEVLEYVDAIESENEKLRKLVFGLNWCAECVGEPRVECERCPLGPVEGKPLELTCENMMHELGIEMK